MQPSDRSPPTPVTPFCTSFPAIQGFHAAPGTLSCLPCTRVVCQSHFSRPTSQAACVPVSSHPVPSLTPTSGSIPDKPSGTWAKNTGSGVQKGKAASHGLWHSPALSSWTGHCPWEPQFSSLINKDHKSTDLLSCFGNVPSVPAPPCSKGPGGITSSRSKDMWGNRK